MSWLRNAFLTGLLVVVPVLGTLVLVNFVIGAVDGWLGPQYRPLLPNGKPIPGFGIAVFVVATLLVGGVTHNFVGRAMVKLGEDIVARIPFISTVYTLFKRVTTSMLEDGMRQFSEAYYVEFPRKGLWTVGFRTGNVPPASGERMSAHMGFDDGAEMLCLYVPTSPNPTGGYFVMVRPDQVIPTGMSVEQAWTLVLSMGMLTAPGSRPPESSTSATGSGVGGAGGGTDESNTPRAAQVPVAGLTNVGVAGLAGLASSPSLPIPPVPPHDIGSTKP